MAGRLLEKMSTSESYHLGRISFQGRMGDENGRFTLDGKENLQRILEEYRQKETFSITSEDSSSGEDNGKMCSGEDNGKMCSGEVLDLTYYGNLPPGEPVGGFFTIPFGEFLERGRPQIITKSVKFSPEVEGKSVHVGQTPLQNYQH